MFGYRNEEICKCSNEEMIVYWDEETLEFNANPFVKCHKAEMALNSVLNGSEGGEQLSYQKLKLERVT